MPSTRPFTADEARQLGDLLGIDWDEIEPEQFHMGLRVELEHGSHNSSTDVTRDDPLLTGKIAWAHLKEFPDYYTRLARMEAKARHAWPDGRSSG